MKTMTGCKKKAGNNRQIDHRFSCFLLALFFFLKNRCFPKKTSNDLGDREQVFWGVFYTMLATTKSWWQCCSRDGWRSVCYCGMCTSFWHTFSDITLLVPFIQWCCLMVTSSRIIVWKKIELQLNIALRTIRKQIPFTQRRVKLTRHAPLGAPEIFSSDYRRGKISLGILCTFMVSLLSDPIVGRCWR